MQWDVWGAIFPLFKRVDVKRKWKQKHSNA